MTDIEIARKAKTKPIIKIAQSIRLKQKDIVTYGDNKAKIVTRDFKKQTKQKLVLITSMSPSSAGIGKTTISIGLADALKRIKKSVCLALREPSLGPVFGIKGGATGGGYSQVVPMEDINLHFTGDFHAITSANNLLCSMIDNHIYQGNALKLDPEKIMFHRCLDINDRALRVTHVGNTKNETPRQDKFTITAASEIMAIMALSNNIEELKERLSNILIGYTKRNKPVFARDMGCVDAMAILLKDAMHPNLVQTLEGTPALIHLGPFANIAHGCNSVTATKMAMSLADYTITEAGFGSELGAEKFLDLKCRLNNLTPNAVVMVATLPAIRLQGGAEDPKTCNLDAVKTGLCNLLKHCENIKLTFNLPVVVAINAHPGDTEEEYKAVQDVLDWLKIESVICTSYTNGGAGCIDLANKIINMCESNVKMSYAYRLTDTIEEKITAIATKLYGARGIKLSDSAKDSIKSINKLGLSELPIVIAKTQYSLGDNPKALGIVSDYDLNITDIELKSGAGFIVAIACNMMLMPGLGKNPAGCNMKIDKDHIIEGLF